MSKILLIEDDEELVELVRLRLKGAGYEVSAAGDAMHGVKMAHQTQPDLILIDLKIPAGGGVSVLRNLRKSINTKHIPVLIVTGTSDANLKSQLLEFGIKTYIQKPFTAEDLLHAITGVLLPPQ